MATGRAENRILLRGVVASPPQPSHENHGQVYQTFQLAVARHSGAVDRLNMMGAEGLFAACPLQLGQRVELWGEVRSFNNRCGTGSRLVITVLAQALRPTLEEDANCLHLWGSLCKAPVLRRTPLGRDICDLMLAVNRRYRRADYLPCIAWGALAQLCGKLSVGDELRMVGRLQSRIYQKIIDGQAEERQAFEISIMELEEE